MSKCLIRVTSDGHTIRPLLGSTCDTCPMARGRGNWVVGTFLQDNGMGVEDTATEGH